MAKQYPPTQSVGRRYSHRPAMLAFETIRRYSHVRGLDAGQDLGK